MFNYVSMADYFIVYVGNEIDCGIIDNLYFFILFEKRDFFKKFSHNFKEISHDKCFAAIKFNGTDFYTGNFIDFVNEF